MLNEINLSRKNPKKIRKKVEKYIKNIGKNSKNEYYIKVDNYNKIKLFHGIEMFENCIKYLDTIEENKPFEYPQSRRELRLPRHSLSCLPYTIRAAASIILRVLL